MISLELFISGELRSNDEVSILRAIGLLQSLLVRKHSNMKALALLLLDDNKKLRDAAAAHLRLGCTMLILTKIIQFIFPIIPYNRL